MKRTDRSRTPRLSHVDARGRARMVDVSAKPPTLREAVAAGTIRMSHAAFRTVRSRRAAKGDAVAIARIAGISAAKRTSELIPLCHAIPLEHVEVDVRFGANRLLRKIGGRSGEFVRADRP